MLSSMSDAVSQTKIERKSLKDEVKDRLIQCILKGEYPPGYALREVSLAKELGTSAIPVREALRELESLRLVESVPYKGTRVREISPQEMKEAYELRALLEAYAGRTAAKVLEGKTEILENHLDAMRKAAKKADIEAYVEYDLPFHRHIVEAAGNSLLLHSWDLLGFEIRARVYLQQDPRKLADVVESHQAIIDALHKGKAKTAAKLLEQHSLGLAEGLDAHEKSLD